MTDPYLIVMLIYLPVEPVVVGLFAYWLIMRKMGPYLELLGKNKSSFDQVKEFLKGVTKH